MIIRLFLLQLALFAFVALPAYAACGANEPRCISDVVPLLKTAISLLAPAAAIAFFIMVLIGGWQFLSSGGDQKAVGQARNTLTYAVIGVILVVVAWFILLIIENVTGVGVTNVDLPITP